MAKKELFSHVSVALPVTLLVLFFSLIIASRSSGVSSVGIQINPYRLIASHFMLEMKEAERLKMLALYVSAYLKTVGKAQLMPFVPLRSSVRLRPASAHAYWKRVKKESIFAWPVDPASFWISSYFGPRVLKGRKGFHQGIDMAAVHGTPVVAAADGYVKEARYAPGYGNYILLIHPKRYKTRYAHLSKMSVKTNQRVRAGQLIGNVGATGRVTKSKWGKSASHLHFEVYSNGKRINPFNVLA